MQTKSTLSSGICFKMSRQLAFKILLIKCSILFLVPVLDTLLAECYAWVNVQPNVQSLLRTVAITPHYCLVMVYLELRHNSCRKSWRATGLGWYQPVAHNAGRFILAPSSILRLVFVFGIRGSQFGKTTLLRTTPHTLFGFPSKPTQHSHASLSLMGGFLLLGSEHRRKNLVAGVAGLGPATHGLTDHCSTTELHTNYGKNYTRLNRACQYTTAKKIGGLGFERECGRKERTSPNGRDNMGGIIR